MISLLLIRGIPIESLYQQFPAIFTMEIRVWRIQNYRDCGYTCNPHKFEIPALWFPHRDPVNPCKHLHSRKSQVYYSFFLFLRKKGLFKNSFYALSTNPGLVRFCNGMIPWEGKICTIQGPLVPSHQSLWTQLYIQLVYKATLLKTIAIVSHCILTLISKVLLV